jgi:hypothetical protein
LHGIADRSPDPSFESPEKLFTCGSLFLDTQVDWTEVITFMLRRLKSCFYGANSGLMTAGIKYLSIA